MGMEIPQGDINTNLITYTITSILTRTQHHNALSAGASGAHMVLGPLG